MGSWWARRGLATRILLMVIALVAILTVVIDVVFVRNHTESAEQAMVRKAEAFTAVADEAKNHASTLVRSGTYNIDVLLKETLDTLAKGGDYTQTRLFNAIPVVVGWTTAEKAAKAEGISFRVAAFEARNKKREPEHGSFSEQLLRDLESQIAAGGPRTISRIDSQSNTLHHMRAIGLDASCMMCHGKPGGADDPDKDGKDPLGFAMEDWPSTGTHGAYEVMLPLAGMQAETASFITGGLMWSVPLSIGCVLAFYFLLQRSFVRPTAAMATRIREIAEGEGDLTARLNENVGGELGFMSRVFNQLLARLERLVIEMSRGAEEIRAGSAQVSSASQSLASGATQQAANLEQISASLTQITGMTDANAGNVRNAASSSEQSRHAAERCQESMQRMTDAMDGIKASSDSIARVLRAIDEIAFQTNLLALNAAVEAARAGDAGKGFAVVAEEVRNLAQRSATAARETAQMVEESTTRATTAVGLCEEVASGLGHILKSTRDVDQLLQEVAKASSEQAQGIAIINNGVAELDKVTQQSAGNAEELAASSEQTAAQVQSLRDLVKGFHVTDD